MTDADPISHWLAHLKAGDQDAAQRLWERYFARLVGLARARLGAAPRAVADEEDVALSAFDSFVRRAAAGRFPQLNDRDDLWRVLVVIVTRKAGDYADRERRLKRGGAAAVADVDWGRVIGSEPTPEFVARVAEQCDKLLRLLTDDELRSVALWKMDGFTNDEIAAKLGVAPRTVERKLGLIRKLWQGWETGE